MIVTAWGCNEIRVYDISEEKLVGVLRGHEAGQKIIAMQITSQSALQTLDESGICLTWSLKDFLITKRLRIAAKPVVTKKK